MLYGSVWEVMLTVRTFGLKNEQEAYDAIQSEIIRPLSKILHTQIAGLGIHNRLNDPHAHVLLFSRHGVLSKLSDLNLCELLKRKGNRVATHERAVHIAPYENEGGIEYVVSNFPARSGKGGLLYFNQHLLETVKVAA